MPWSQLVPEQVAGDHTCPGPGLVLPATLPQAPVGKGSQVDLGKEVLGGVISVLDPLGQAAAAEGSHAQPEVGGLNF